MRFIPAALLAATPAQTGRVLWSPHLPVWTRYEDTQRLARLLQMVQRKGGQTFLSSADALVHMEQKEKAA